MSQWQETANYGFNKIIKKYANFPWYLPLPAHMEHGWTSHEKSLRTDLQTDKPLMLVFNKKRKKLWREESQIPVEIMGSPYIHYKNINDIKRKKKAQGTLVFISHSTYDVKKKYDLEALCEELKKLPKSFHPITICLFYLDLFGQKEKLYKKLGFRIVSAGPRFTYSLDFVNNFYRLLSSHKYTASNSIGSYTFCSVDLGIPFFLIGQKPITVNVADKDQNVREVDRGAIKISNQASSLFSTGPIKQISKKQSEYVKKEMGVGSCLSGQELRNVLLKHSKKNRYWIFVVPHLLNLLFSKLVFDAPWTGIIIKARVYIAGRGNNA